MDIEDASRREIAEEFYKNVGGVDPQSQFNVMVEEVGELAEAVNEGDVEKIPEEIADVAVTAELLAVACMVDLDEEYRKKMEYNLQKTGTREGGKIQDDAGGYKD